MAAATCAPTLHWLAATRAAPPTPWAPHETHAGACFFETVAAHLRAHGFEEGATPCRTRALVLAWAEHHLHLPALHATTAPVTIATLLAAAACDLGLPPHHSHYFAYMHTHRTVHTDIALQVLTATALRLPICMLLVPSTRAYPQPPLTSPHAAINVPHALHARGSLFSHTLTPAGPHSLPPLTLAILGSHAVRVHSTPCTPLPSAVLTRAITDFAPHARLTLPPSPAPTLTLGADDQEDEPPVWTLHQNS